MTAEVILIGTGPAATASAMALRRLGIDFTVIDVGHDLEADRDRRVQSLASTAPAQWNQSDVDALFPPPAASTRGVQKRFAFGSDFPYRGHDHLRIDADDCQVDVSHALGGFGNVWGAAMLPWPDSELDGWPVSHAALAPSYRRVSEFVPTSAERDELEDAFPLYAGNHTLTRTDQGDRLLRALERRRRRLRGRGVRFGRARVAVDASDGPNGCRYCGHCLEGCVYGAIFSPRPVWRRLADEGVTIHRGCYVLEVQETGHKVTVTAVDLQTGAPKTLEADRVLCAAGSLGSTRLMARSLGLQGRAVGILDSQYFFFPLLSYRGAADASGRFTLAEVFLELDNPDVCDRSVHFQVYGMNEIFRQTLRDMIPAPMRRRALLSRVETRFLLFQGFLHSNHSGGLEMTVARSSASGDEVRLRGRTNPSAPASAARALSFLRKELAGVGVVPPGALQLLPPGRSFHAGGSFPMDGSHPVLSSDEVGRPAGLSRVHLLDASAFPSIPAATITLTAMANADRIIHSIAEQGLLS